MLNATSPSIEENINLGDKDSIRRRALLTLEGKTDVGAFSRVEIPELENPDLERRFDFRELLSSTYPGAFPHDFLIPATKPSFPPGMGAGFGGSLSSLGGSKRDSLGKFRASVSSKEQLGTLVEEDEEAEDVGYERSPVSPNLDGFRMEQVSSPIEMAAVEVPPAPARHRPTTLNLRPLSLASNHRQPSDLPTPEPSPNPRPRSGLRALTLSPSLSIETVQPPVDTENAQKRRQSMFVSSSTSSSFEPARRPSLSSATKENAPLPVPRRTSISYVSSSDSSSFPISGLPTPEMTPTSDRRYSISSESSSSSSLGSRGSRSLSTSEHHFLYQAHTALVQRISDLERALSARPRSRHQSYASEASNPIEPPTDEMLQLITDLKSERDELKKDVEGWRTRVSDCSGQVTLLMKRVEVERREAWVARERAGQIEIEKKSLEKTLSDKETWGEQGWRKYETTQSELAKALDECQRLRQKTTRCEELQSECMKLAAVLMEERKKREEVERELDSLLTTPTPQAVDSKYHTPPVSRTMIFAKRSGLGFRSIDSTGSFTDVESLSDPSERPQFSLKSVEEEEEYEEYSQEYSQELSQSDSNDVDGLAGYEDEDENDDYSFHASLSNSSFGSGDFPRETSHLLELSVESEVPELTSSRSVSPSPAPESPPQSHRRRVSLSKAWTFPRSTDSALVMPPRETEEIDRFFGCLEDVDNSPPIDSKLRSAESSKNLFSQALADADDDLPPFFIPTAVGVEVPASESRTGLDVVIEEDEADDEDESESDSADIDDDVSEIVGEVVDGGIIFTFTPPADFGIPEDVPLSQPAPEAQRQESERVFSKPSLSSIPRPASKVFVSSIPTASSTPPRTTSAVAFPKPTGSPATFSTPIKTTNSSSPQASSTPKRTQGSFIPQPRRSSPMSNTSSRPMYSTPTKGQSKPRSSMYDYRSAIFISEH